MGKGRLANPTWLLSADAAGSVLIAQSASSMHMRAHCVYGYRPRDTGPLISFNGEWLADLASGYLLGNGYRLYSPVLMRFVSADDLSPFGKGGYNSYGYCVGDPVNRVDPSGHGFSWTGMLKGLGLMKRTPRQQYSADIGKQIYRDAESDIAVRKLASDPQHNENVMLKNPSGIPGPQGNVPSEPLSLGNENARLKSELENARAQVAVLRGIANELRGINAKMLEAMRMEPEEIRCTVHRDLARIGVNVSNHLAST